MDLEDVLTLIAALNEHGVEYAVVGGVALNFRGLARATADIDLFVKPTPENVSRLREALRAVYKDDAVDEITAEDLGGDYPAVQYVPPTGDFHLDILARLGEMFSYDDIEWSLVEVEGQQIRTATPEMLFRMKRDTVRPQDHADAMRLLERYKLKDE